jgi:hypothetical protein
VECSNETKFMLFKKLFSVYLVICIIKWRENNKGIKHLENGEIKIPHATEIHSYKNDWTCTNGRCRSYKVVLQW